MLDFVFTDMGRFINLANSTVNQKQSNEERPLGVLYPHGLQLSVVVEFRVCVYLHRRGVSTLLVSIDRAMREPTSSGTSSRLAPRFLCLYAIPIIVNITV